jgi:hypothetical protein
MGLVQISYPLFLGVFHFKKILNYIFLVFFNDFNIPIQKIKIQFMKKKNYFNIFLNKKYISKPHIE